MNATKSAGNGVGLKVYGGFFPLTAQEARDYRRPPGLYKVMKFIGPL